MPFTQQHAAFLTWLEHQAADRGGSVSRHSDFVILQDRIGANRIVVRPLETESVLVDAGWFVRFGIDIEPAHMRESAQDVIRAVMDGSATEFLVIVDDGARVDPAGWVIEATSLTLSEQPTPDGRAVVAHTVPAWRSSPTQA